MRTNCLCFECHWCRVPGTSQPIPRRGRAAERRGGREKNAAAYVSISRTAFTANRGEGKINGNVISRIDSFLLVAKYLNHVTWTHTNGTYAHKIFHRNRNLNIIQKQCAYIVSHRRESARGQQKKPFSTRSARSQADGNNNEKCFDIQQICQYRAAPNNCWVRAVILLLAIGLPNMYTQFWRYAQMLYKLARALRLLSAFHVSLHFSIFISVNSAAFVADTIAWIPF